MILYDRVEPNPTDQMVNEASAIVVENKIDYIVGLGGGSALDTAKAVSIVSSNEGYAWDYVNYPEGPRLIPYLNRPVICIPTTAGTGSEVNRYSVISNPKRKEKLVISHSELSEGCHHRPNPYPFHEPKANRHHWSGCLRPCP